jgi:hypothetical protein
MIQMPPRLPLRGPSVAATPILLQSQGDLGVDDYPYGCWAGLILTRLCPAQLFEDHQET